MFISDVHLSLNQCDDAICYAKKCIDNAKKTGDKQMEIDAYSKLGDAYILMKQNDDSFSFTKTQTDIARENDEQFAKMKSLFKLGNAYWSVNKYDEAFLYCKMCIEIAREIGYRHTEMKAHLVMGSCNFSLKQYDDAIINCKKCIDIASEIGYRYTEMMAHLVIGDAHLSLNEFDDAIFFSEICIDISKEIGYKHTEMKANCVIRDAFLSLKRYDDARLSSIKCIEMAKKTGDKQAEANANIILGYVYLAKYNFHDAMFYAKKCIETAKGVGNKVAEANSYLLLAKVYLAQCYFRPDAIFYAKKSIDIAKETGDKPAERQAYVFLADLYYSMKDCDNFAIYSKKYIEISEEQRSDRKICLALGNLYLKLGQYDEAIRYCDIAKESVDIDDRLAAYHDRADACFHINRYEDFILNIIECLSITEELSGFFYKNSVYLKFYTFLIKVDTEKDLIPANTGGQIKVNDHQIVYQTLADSLEQATETNDDVKKLVALRGFYIYYKQRDDFEKAIECLQKLMELELVSLNSLINACCNHLIAILYKVLKQIKKAVQHFELGLSYAKSINFEMVKFECSKSLGFTHLIRGENDDAKKNFKKAIRSSEYLRKLPVLDEEDKFKFVDKVVHCYRMLSTILIERHQLKECVLVLDQCRARVLTDILLEKYDMEQKVPDENGLHYTDIETLLSSNKYSIMFFDSHYPHSSLLMFYIIEHKKELLPIVCDFDDDRNYLITLTEKAFNQMQVRQVISCEDRSLDGKEDIEVNQKNSDEDETARLPFKRVKTDLSISDYSGKEEKPSDKGIRDSALEVLYHKLFGKISIEQDEIVIIPDGPLYSVPFAALRDPDTRRYLSETKRIRLAPSITTLKLLSDCPLDQHCKKGALIIGNPLVGKVMLNGKIEEVAPLPNAFLEALAIAGLFYVTPFTGEKATKPAIIERLKQGVSVIHIAAHGSLSKATIALAPSPEIRAKKIPDEEDYMLTMADVQQAQVRAQLVVLSCCHSGRGKIRAEGVVGMCRAFLASGARAVVASLWAIDDEASYDFMKSFYLNLREGKSASTSLQQTMKEMRNRSDYKEPKYWAPFFLMGDDVTLKF